MPSNRPFTSQSDTRPELPCEEDWPACMRRAQGGDQKAYQRLLQAMLPFIQGLVRRRIYDATLAEDVVQDTLLTVHRLRHTYEPGLPIQPWIGAIVAARSIDALRRQGRIRHREVSDGESFDRAIDEGAGRIADRLGMDRDIRHLLEQLPERQRKAIEMVKLQEMTLNDAAAESSLSVPAIKSLLHRALATLRDIGSHHHG